FVVGPVCDATAGDAEFVRVTVRERVRGHEAAVAPAPDADARRVNVRLTLEPVEAVLQVAHFQFAEFLIERPSRLNALVRGGAIVADPDDVTFLGEHLMPEVRDAAPSVVHLRRLRPRIGELKDWILLRRIEIRRLDHHYFHREAIARLNL